MTDATPGYDFVADEIGFSVDADGAVAIHNLQLAADGDPNNGYLGHVTLNALRGLILRHDPQLQAALKAAAYVCESVANAPDRPETVAPAYAQSVANDCRALIP